MNWTELLSAEIEGVYGAVDGLVDLVADDDLGFKPATGENWMTVGQLLEHLTTACGFCMRGIGTGDWTPPEGASFPEQEDCEGGLAPAVKMPTVKSVADAKARIAADRETAVEMVRKAGDEWRSIHAWQSVAGAGALETGPPILRGRQEESNCA